MSEPKPNVNECSLNPREQRRNMVLYALCAAMVYLSAPIVYVGIVQVSLCNALGLSDAAANLPSAAFYFAMTAPLFVAWRFHTVAAVKPVLCVSFLLAALACLLVALVLVLQTSAAVRLIALVLHGGAIGGTTAVTSAFQWEVISRGMEVRRRGFALSMAYGVGPLFAVVGSMGAQLVLAGAIELPWYSPQYGLGMIPLAMPRVEFPRNFAFLFAAAAPLLALAALLTTRYVLPPQVGAEPPRLPLIAGLRRGSREFLRDMVLRRAMIAYLLVGAGGSVVTIMALYTPEAMGRASVDFAGYQSAIRFAFKMTAGLFLGWLVVRTHAKMGAIVTATLYLAGVFWVLLVPHAWFMICFGLMGAGDLSGVYFPNYIMTASSPDKVRYNVAYLQLMNLPICAAPTFLGVISDAFGRQASFLAAAGLLMAAVTVITLGLPPDPRPVLRHAET